MIIYKNRPSPEGALSLNIIRLEVRGIANPSRQSLQGSVDFVGSAGHRKKRNLCIRANIRGRNREILRLEMQR
jgi:hypothetical protein